MSGPMMACGHAAQGINGNGDPVCVICYVGGDADPAITPMDPNEAAARVEGRMMRCSYLRGPDGKPCEGRRNPIPSDPTAAFFQSRPDEEYDQYFDGCWGWD